MNHRFLCVLGVALLAATAASLVLHRVMARPAPSPQAGATVVVAAQDLPVGTLIKETDLKLEKLAGGIPAGAARSQKELLGRGVVAPIYGDEIVLDSRLAARGAGAGLAALIPPGKRAAAVRVNEVVGVAGFVVPGMRVDVLISGNPPAGWSGEHSGSVTRTLLENIEVLSAGQKFQKDAEGKPVAAQVVNLVVTPEQAEILGLASHQATIQLVLRNPVDAREAHPPGVGLEALYGPRTASRGSGPRPVAARAPRPAPEAVKQPEAREVLVVEVLHGTRKAEARFTQGVAP
jgi:pilus assembly protein CpaB